MGDLGSTGFTGLLVLGAAVAAALSAGWLALVALAAVVEVRSGGRRQLLRLTGCPPGLRRLLLRLLVPLLAPALGAGLGGAWTGADAAIVPGHGGTGGAGSLPSAGMLDGLPLPQRSAGPTEGAAHGTTGPAPARTVVVRTGDSLWSIAVGTLPPRADTGQVAGLCRQLYRTNRAVVGDDPDVIHPGQRLRVPPTHEEHDR